MYSIRPIDREAIRKAAHHGFVITAEEHNVTGGFGAAVAEVMAEEGIRAKLIKVGMPDEYSLLGPPTHLYRHYHLDGEGLAATVRKALSSRPQVETPIGDRIGRGGYGKREEMGDGI